MIADLKAIDVQLMHSLRALWSDRFYIALNHAEVNKDRWTTSWRHPIKTGSARFPYHVPIGWRRFSVKAEASYGSFKTFENSCIMYHGLRPENVTKIIRNGFIPRKCQHGAKAVYLTPSIIYASHPRYAKVIFQGGRYFQVALEVRLWTQVLNDKSKVEFCGETLSVQNRCTIDPNVSNDELEVIVKSGADFVTPQDGLAVTGVLVRALGHDPVTDPLSDWWLYWPMGKVGGGTKATDSDGEAQRQELKKQEAMEFLRAHYIVK